MTVGTLIEKLIYYKRKYEIYYPDDEAINKACNVLERLPYDIDVDDWIDQQRRKEK